FNDYGTDGGTAAKELSPKMAVILKYLNEAGKIDVMHFVAISIGLKAIGGFLFVFGSSLGAFFLLIHLAFTTPLLYDFYNYSYGDPEFFALLQEFLQSVALFGALLYFLGMKSSIARRQLKKKTPKTKTG
ncbi:Eukaryotic translation initiation factor 2A like, partial [Actinidia chinensis var. chinensis]